MASRKKTKGGGPFEALRAMKDEIAARAPAPPAPAAPAPRKPSPPSEDAPEDEALLFHRLFAGVEPLDRSRGRVSRQPAHETSRSPEAAGAAGRRREAAQAESEAVHERLRALVEPEGRFEVADDGSHVEGRRSDLPADALRRLRRGLLPIDARLDLHGMRLEEARAELAAFLRTMRARGERCVLVIHGKGAHSPQGVGVLRGEIAAWLSQGAASQHVAAFATAREGDGGGGAVYVLLRR